MHKSKEKIRGFNQAKLIANSVSEKLDIPIIYIIEKWVDTESQIKKSIYQRWVNQENKFRLKPLKNINQKKKQELFQ